jgi:hypothetical protein
MIGSRTHITNTCDDEFDVFSIKIRLHQMSALSPYIFTLMMDEITNDIQGDILGVCSLLMMWY